MDRKYDYSRVGINARLILFKQVYFGKIKYFQSEIRLRNKVAINYNKLITKSAKKIQLPFIEEGNKSVYGQYSILLKIEIKRLKILRRKIPCNLLS